MKNDCNLTAENRRKLKKLQTSCKMLRILYLITERRNCKKKTKNRCIGGSDYTMHSPEYPKRIVVVTADHRSHNHIASVSMWCWVISPFYDICSFWSIAINIMYRFIFAGIFLPISVLFSARCNIYISLVRDVIYTSRAYATMSLSVCSSVCDGSALAHYS